MSKFKRGDMVRRISPRVNEGMKPGAIATVGCAGDHFVTLLEYDGHHANGNLELVSNNPPHKHAEVIKAWADGAIIQYRVDDELGLSLGWIDCLENIPSWNIDYQYRVKPVKTNASKIAELEAKAQEIANELNKLKENI